MNCRNSSIVAVLFANVNVLEPSVVPVDDVKVSVTVTLVALVLTNAIPVYVVVDSLVGVMKNFVPADATRGSPVDSEFVVTRTSP